MLTATGQALVEIRNLRFRYPGGNQDTLRIPALIVSGRGLIALTGPSGAGKSTLVELLAGTLREPYEGSVQVLGTELSSLTRDADRQRHIRRVGLIPQDFGLLPGMTVGEILEQDLSDAEAPRGERDGRVVEALTQVGMEGFADRAVERLSGGQRQRVAIARMLARDVDMVVADEPTANLDPSLVEQTVSLLRQLAERKPVILVTHDPAVAERCDRTILLQAASPQEGAANSTPVRNRRSRSPITLVAVAALGSAGLIGVVAYLLNGPMTFRPAGTTTTGQPVTPLVTSPPITHTPTPAPPPPAAVARLVVAPAVGNVPVDVTADASGSTGVPPLTFTFNFGDGTPAASQSSPTINHRFQVAGTFPVTVTVADASGRTAQEQKSITLSWTIPTEAQLQGWQQRLSEVTYGLFTVHQGTAFWTDASHLVTASHVVTLDRTSVTLNLQGTAQVSARDSVYDQALLAAGSPPAPDPTAVFQLSDSRPAIGEPLWGLCAVGPQFVVPLTVSDPSAKWSGTPLEDTATYSFSDALLLTGQAHQGCGGGPVVDGTGRVVGEIIAASNGTTVAVLSVDIRTWLASLGYPPTP